MTVAIRVSRSLPMRFAALFPGTEGDGPDAMPTALPASGEVDGAHAKPRILIVEDDATAARALARLLRSRGFEVDHAIDLTGARNAVRSTTDVVILDLMLPDGPGHSLIPKVREANSRARVIVTTGMSDRRALAAAFAAGAERVIIKPIDFAELLSLL